MKPEARVLKFFLQLYLRREMCMILKNVHDPQKMCMILSPNCCAVTIFEYSSTDVTLLPSCLSLF